PSAADAGAILVHRNRSLTGGRLDEETWEVDTRIDGELERAPEAANHLHEVRPGRGGDCHVLDHRGASSPVEAMQQLLRQSQELGVRRDAFPIDAHPA